MSTKLDKKFTDEQLSRILSHAEELYREGVQRTGCMVGCVNQAAYNSPDRIGSYGLNEDAANAFDHYRGPKTPDAILQLLERAGCA